MTLLTTPRPRSAEPPVPVRSRQGHGALRTGLRLAAMGGLGFTLLYAGFVRTGTGQWADDAAMRSVAAWAGPWTTSAHDVLTPVSAPACVPVALGIALAAGAAGRSRQALSSLAVSAGVPLMAEAAKLLLVRPALLEDAAANSFPSGTVAAVAGLVGAAYVVTEGTARRAVAAIGVAVLTVVSGAVVVSAWHRPSDVLAALCLAAVGVGLGVAVSVPRSVPRGCRMRAAGHPVRVAVCRHPSRGVPSAAWSGSGSEGWPAPDPSEASRPAA